MDIICKELSRKTAEYLQSLKKSIVINDGRHTLVTGQFSRSCFVSAIENGAITLESDGTIIICLELEYKPDLDIPKIRRRVENYLRTQATVKDIITIASIIGVRFK